MPPTKKSPKDIGIDPPKQTYKTRQKENIKYKETNFG